VFVLLLPRNAIARILLAAFQESARTKTAGYERQAAAEIFNWRAASIHLLSK